jgi:equilibrative nucleoside transporter 1/2/3
MYSKLVAVLVIVDMPSELGAQYHPIPQAPVVADLEVETPYISLDGEVSAEEQPTSILSPATLDPRIRWIHFVLGCAVLLPWNGIF